MTVAVLGVAGFVVVMVALCWVAARWVAPWVEYRCMRRGFRRAIRIETFEAAERDVANDLILTERTAS